MRVVVVYAFGEVGVAQVVVGVGSVHKLDLDIVQLTQASDITVRRTATFSLTQQSVQVSRRLSLQEREAVARLLADQSIATQHHRAVRALQKLLAVSLGELVSCVAKNGEARRSPLKRSFPKNRDR